MPELPEDDIEFRLREIERRLENVVRMGTVDACDYDSARARVRIGDLITVPLPWLTRRAGGDRDWWAPETGEQVMILSPSGNIGQGVILPAVYSDAAPAPADTADISRMVFGDGVVIEHDRAKKLLRINAIDAEATLVLEAKNVIVRTGDGGYYQLDRFGLVERITHMGGANYETDSWTTGAVITGNPDQGHNPPEVLTSEES